MSTSSFTIFAISSFVKALSVVVLTLPCMPNLSNWAEATLSLEPSTMAT